MYCAPQVNNISGFEAVLISEFTECTVHHRRTTYLAPRQS